MSWTKLDDRFWGNPKILAAGNEATGVYCRALSYCSEHLTEGHIPDDALRLIAGRRKPIDALLEAKLIVQNGTGYVIPDYLEFNPSRAEIEAIRKKRASAGRRGGRSKGEANA